MRRALRGTVGIVLAIGAVLPARSASAQPPARRLWYQSDPVQKVQYESTVVLQEGHSRLEEMKVELALLADIATFPYSLGARAAGETLALRGYVPNEMVRQRAVELARQNTFLTVRDELIVQTNLSLRSPLRPAEVLQLEGAALLQKNLGEPAKQMSIGVRPNGAIVLTGRIDSVESKLAVSRLFRSLSGCSGVVNELTVGQVLRDGRRVLQVTRDGSITAPPSALGAELRQIVASAPTPATVAPAPLPETPRPTEAKPTLLPPPPPLLSRGLDAQDGELRLPTLSKPTSAQPKLSPEKQGTRLDSLIPPQLPTKWGQSTTSRESQEVKRQSTTPTASKPTSQQEKAPATHAAPIRWVDTTKPIPFAESKKPSRARNAAHPSFAESQQATAPDMTWHSPRGSEESEPNAAVATKKTEKASSSPTTAKPSGAPLRRWPSAYESSTSQSNGRPGTITFDDDPQQAPKPNLAPMATAHPIVLANLQRQVKSVCGRQARDVVVEMQRDGAILVKVKVPNQSVVNQLTGKILGVPEMTSPKVRLMMDVGP